MNGERMSRNSIIISILNLSPNYYSFLGGVFISAAINLYTGVFASEVIPTRWRTILLSALLAFLSGVLWSIVAWNLEKINRLAIAQSPEFVDEQVIWRKLVLSKLPKLTINLICAFLCAAISSIILLF